MKTITLTNTNSDNFTNDEPYANNTIDIIGYGLRDGASPTEYDLAKVATSLRLAAHHFAQLLLDNNIEVSNDYLRLLDVTVIEQTKHHFHF